MHFLHHAPFVEHRSNLMDYCRQLADNYHMKRKTSQQLSIKLEALESQLSSFELNVLTQFDPKLCRKLANLYLFLFILTFHI